MLICELKRAIAEFWEKGYCFTDEFSLVAAKKPKPQRKLRVPGHIPPDELCYWIEMPRFKPVVAPFEMMFKYNKNGESHGSE